MTLTQAKTVQPPVKILIVSQQADQQEALQEVLRADHYALQFADSCEQALRLALTRQFALIMLDHNTTGLDVLVCARELRQLERCQATPMLLLIYSRHIDEMVAQMGGLGLIDYLFKPVEMLLLRSKMAMFAQLQLTISSLHQRTSELELMTRALQRSREDLQQFVSVASHDLQEPLTAVTGCVQLLQARSANLWDARSQELAQHAVEGAERMRELLKQLQNLSRLGSRSLNLVAVDCDKVLDSTLTRLAQAIRDSQASITREHLPTLMADSQQLGQLFEHLLDNAIKYRSKAPPQIHVAAKRHPDGWEFTFKDNGIGIEQGFFNRIFEAFQRLHTRDAYPGTGIGLAICKRIVQSHGGQIWLESTPGVGSTFHFVIADPAAIEQ